MMPVKSRNILGLFSQDDCVFRWVRDKSEAKFSLIFVRNEENRM